MRNKPVEPKRVRETYRYYLPYEITIEELSKAVDKLIEEDPTTDTDRKICIDRSYDNCDVYIKYSRLQPKAHYETSVSYYKERLAQYKKWARENAEEIRQALENKKAEKNLKLLMEKDRLEKQIEAIKKKL